MQHNIAGDISVHVELTKTTLQ